jgi:hypothetical protein
VGDGDIQRYYWSDTPLKSFGPRRSAVRVVSSEVLVVDPGNEADDTVVESECFYLDTFGRGKPA